MERMPPTKVFQGKKYFIVEDLVKILKLTPLTVREYLKKGRIASVKVGQRYYVAEGELIKFLNSGRFTKPDEFASQVNEAIRRTFEANIEFLAYRVKEIITKDLTSIIQGNIKKIDQQTTRMTEFHENDSAVMKERFKKTQQIRKDFSITKKM
ncbi:hypothetical protein ES705_09503 [subsurface metagenome]